MMEAQATYETAVETQGEPTPADALIAECRALLNRISQVSGIPIVQAQETAPINLQAGTAKTPDGKDVAALVIHMDRAVVQAAALFAVLRDAGIVTADAVDLAVLRAKRDIISDVAAQMDAKAAEAKAQASKLTVAKGPALVLPAGANRAARRGHLTRVRD